MNKYILIGLVSILSLGILSCNKNGGEQNCPPIEVSVPQNEVSALEAFLEDRGIEAVKDDRGFYYEIINEGNGANPDACSSVEIDYEGKLTNDFVFDSNDKVTFPLTSLILGWRLGVPHVKEGGTIILYLPPTLGYGSRAQGDIPANSILIFKIGLHKVN